ncbi:acidic phosphatase, putative [Trypanosoma brucei gambiense DAL972]|uniref:Acidic phosphatase, putative n=1 Tax=Trypanosoma brucei gambiense (strain MHOM/CI/86/DAL972) TaxID=679716 RepID=C9ZNG2_TRYB9|nr:acidic phosphatase, putative [Trypanosoma brucei gambiense DAL972]CBH10940.1 acidic phosphatase, putative [Trypanosoma brucei gambiense DAL972]|eukprot:XP_011773227.1 acidic phosphatase, putative [Trypanosoma brucei gambiense DAL972]
MSRTIVLGLGFVLLVCYSGGFADEESYGKSHYKAERKLDVAAGRALCAMTDYSTKVSGESADYFVEESDRLAALLADDKKRVSYYLEYIGPRLDEKSNSYATVAAKLREQCEAAQKDIDQGEATAQEVAEKIRGSIDGAKGAAAQALGEDEIEDHNKATGLLKVLNWHCGGDIKRGLKLSPYSHNCYVIGRRRDYSDGARNVIHCDGLRKSTPYQNVTGTKMKLALDKWDKHKPKAKSGKPPCEDKSKYSGPDICTAWEGWLGDYKRAMTKTHAIVTELRKAQRAVYVAETKLVVLYKIYTLLETDEETPKSILRNVTEFVNQRKDKLERTTVLGENGKHDVDISREIILPNNTEEEEELIQKARDTAPLGISVAVLVVAIVVPLVLLILLFLLLRWHMKKRDEVEGQVEKKGKEEELGSDVLEGNIL